MPMRVFLPIIVAALLLAFISACALGQYGQQYDESYIQSIRKGKTTKEDILSNLGSPAAVALLTGREFGLFSTMEKIICQESHRHIQAMIWVGAGHC